MRAEPDAELIQAVLQVAALHDEAAGVVTATSLARERSAPVPFAELMSMRVAAATRKSSGAGTLGLRPPGAASDEEELGIREVRELSQQGLADLVAAKTSGEGQLPAFSLDTLKTQHHAVARLIAAGLETAEVAAACGMTPTRVSTLRSSPAFQNLVIGYQKMVEAESIDLGISIRVAANKALTKAEDYMSQPIQNIDPAVLKDLTFGLLDRAGHSPVAKSMAMTAAVSRADIQQLKQANAAGNFEVVDAIDLEPLEEQAGTSAASVEAGSPQGGAGADGDDGGSGAVPGPEAKEGLAGGGAEA